MFQGDNRTLLELQLPPTGIMRRISICVFFCLISPCFTSLSDDYFLPFSGLISPLPPETPEPINIISSKAKPIVTTPLVILSGLFDRVHLRNTGHSVEINLDQPITSSIATGGVLYNNIYVLNSFKFHWTDDLNGISGTTCDGKDGTPLEVSIWYCSKKCGSFSNCLNDRDGLFELRIRINVRGSVPNPLFSPLQQYLKQIRKANTVSEDFPIALAFLWFDIFPPWNQYYAYPGSYFKESNGRHYYCSTTVVPPLFPFHFISKEQFKDTFGKFQRLNGTRLTDANPQALQGRRPVVVTRGVLNIPTIGIPFAPTPF
ncbi:carbonic anhydrase 7-like [Planococcus citri]|uniref:carbonic anhydrase 7-like n=1 Tax=Planococcus citri TaxID=170843 RepID=UPI0031FA0864